MNKRILVLAILLAFFGQVSAQKKVFEGLRSYRNSGSGAILEFDKLVGYYTFLLYDKQDKKNWNYELTFMDDNLNTLKKVDVIRPKGDYLVETVFNGNNFVCAFFNKDQVEYICYDKQGKKTGSVLQEDISKYEKMRIQAAQAAEDGIANASVFPIGNTGFVRQTAVDNDKMGYRVSAWDNTLKNLWVFESDVKSKELEMSDIIYTSENHVALMVGRKPSMMSKALTTSLVVIDTKTGKKIFEKPMHDENEMTLLGLFIDDTAKDIVLFGEYFPKGESSMKAKSEGVYIMQLDLMGNELKKNKMSWMSDIRKIMKTDEEMSAEEKDRVRPMFHKIYRTADGQIFAIGEQYMKGGAAALGAAMSMMSRDATMQFKVMNMVVVGIDKNLALNSYTVYSKKKTSLSLPGSYAMVNSTLLAMYVKSIGGFDYAFTSSDKAKDKYVTIYKDFDRKDADGKKADLMLGALKYENGKVVKEKIPMQTDTDNLEINPAKPGYIQITEYKKKTKTLTMRLEKVVY